MWVFMLSLLLSLWSQCLHWKSLLSLWTDWMCLESFSLFERILGQFSHFTFLFSLYSDRSSSDILQSFSWLAIFLSILSFPQIVHVTSFLSCVFFMWLFIFLSLVTEAGHSLHWIFSSWLCMWSFKKYLFANVLEHTSQMWVFSPWVFMWAFNFFLFAKVLEHTSQSVDFRSNLESLSSSLCLGFYLRMKFHLPESRGEPPLGQELAWLG